MSEKKGLFSSTVDSQRLVVSNLAQRPENANEAKLGSEIKQGMVAFPRSNSDTEPR